MWKLRYDIMINSKYQKTVAILNYLEYSGPRFRSAAIELTPSAQSDIVIIRQWITFCDAKETLQQYLESNDATFAWLSA